MRNRCPQHDARRAAFTLVELLVAMAIFVLLATIAIGAYRGLSDTDRLRQGTSEVLGAFNKARSAAIHDKLPRGVRFLYSSSDNVIDSMVLIGSLPPDEGSIVDSKAVNISSGGYTVTGTATTASIWSDYLRTGAFGTQLTTSIGWTGSGANEWYHFNTGDGCIAPDGLRIQIPSGGRFYRISAVGIDPTDSTIKIRLAEPFQTSTASNLDYLLELGATVLPGAEPIALPQNIAIVPTTPGGVVPGTLATFDVLFSKSGAPRIADRNNGDILRLLLADRRDFDTGALAAGGLTPGYEQRVITFMASTGQAYASSAGPRNDYFRFAKKGQEAKQ